MDIMGVTREGTVYTTGSTRAKFKSISGDIRVYDLSDRGLAERIEEEDWVLVRDDLRKYLEDVESPVHPSTIIVEF